jgi:hypothetical protein
MTKVVFGESSFESSNFSAKQSALFAQIGALDIQIVEKNNMLAVLRRAKTSYLNELKGEVLTSKSGFDFTEL